MVEQHQILFVSYNFLLFSPCKVANPWYSSPRTTETIDIAFDPAELPPLYYPPPGSCLDEAPHAAKPVDIITMR